MQTLKRLIIIGAGPAGMMAAIRARGLGLEVDLLEKNSSLGKKLLLSGKGRCNLTNACDLDSFLERFSDNGEFLRDAFKKFFNRELMDFFQQRGLRLKVERQMRVFPATDKSDSVLEVLKKELLDCGVRINLLSQAGDILVDSAKVKAVRLKNGQLIPADKIILATGGLSYSFTGSDGEGLRMAGRLGHKIISPCAGLIPLKTSEESFRALKGLALKNIRIIFNYGTGKIISEIGELLFTGEGISGPLVLSLSGRVVDRLKEGKKIYAEIDLKPALSPKQLDNRLLREFKINSKKSVKNTLKDLLPQGLIALFLGLVKIDPREKCNQVTNLQRRAILKLLKALPLHIDKAYPLEEAMITRGGVCLKEINPRTMESRIIKGLYFAGEIIDVDADTGGFNLQAAFSTGYLAGESAALN